MAIHMYDWALYYYIPWPECQRFSELDENGEFTFGTETTGIMADKDWVDEIVKENGF